MPKERSRFEKILAGEIPDDELTDADLPLLLKARDRLRQENEILRKFQAFAEENKKRDKK